MKIIYELQRKVNNEWKHTALFETYKQAQETFIHKAGLFRILELELKQSAVFIDNSVKGTY